MVTANSTSAAEMGWQPRQVKRKLGTTHVDLGHRYSDIVYGSHNKITAVSLCTDHKKKKNQKSLNLVCEKL